MSSDADRNIRRFIAFRVFFNARFYYPVIAVMFVDYGLTLAQYAALNVAWAISIVCLEVPTGAIADRIGRHKMVVLAAGLMLIEMAVLSLAPVGRSVWLFAAFLGNRVLSGAAEACASGADEALAYDSLSAEGRDGEWPQVLERLARWQSAAFVVAMITGALVYDPRFVQTIAHAVGIAGSFEQQTTVRFPAILTFGMAIGALWSALGMQEKVARHHDHSTWRAIGDAGRWILRTPVALSLILAGLCFDSIVRLFMTFESSYLRLIGIPEYLFGVVGAALAGIGFVMAPAARWMVENWSAGTNFVILGVTIFGGLAGLALAWPIYGVAFPLVLGAAMSLLAFFLSHYLNAEVNSARRATVLSFKSLALNLAYGGIGIGFGLLMRALRGSHGTESDDAIFGHALSWLPGFFAVTCALLAIAWRLARRPATARKA